MHGSLLKSLERTRCGGIILSTDGMVIEYNGTARSVLESIFDGIDFDKVDLADVGRSLIKKLLAGSQSRINVDNDEWVLIERSDKRPLIMHAFPTLVQNQEGPHTVLVLIDLDDTPQISPIALERIFKMTRAEAKLSVLLSSGITIAESAEVLGISVATARSQLASVFNKTRTNRQAELIKLLGRISLIP
ncbi:MAG TPA: LuxR family transcriptional regulator [Methylorubrum populi]|uniref:LuxR family transcriptional regulator n=1 Tax=Methylorubrum populi TaxID=223967 RepID=A0A921E529_9HYPH|nr:LuxR family transcriptional regulator [Methylorubrum populi]